MGAQTRVTGLTVPIVRTHRAWEVLHDGFLWKTGPAPGAAFKWRWFSLFDGRLLYFKEPLDPAPRGIVELGACSVTLLPDVVPEGHCFELSTPDRTFNLKVTCSHDAHPMYNPHVRGLLALHTRIHPALDLPPPPPPPTPHHHHVVGVFLTCTRWLDMTPEAFPVDISQLQPILKKLLRRMRGQTPHPCSCAPAQWMPVPTSRPLRWVFGVIGCQWALC